MNIADTTRKLLRPLGYLDQDPCQSGTPSTSKGDHRTLYQRIICSIACLTITIPAFWSVIFENEVLAEKTKAMMAFICSFTNFVLYIIMLWQRHNILNMFDELQRITLARSKYPVASTIYKNANESYTKLVRITDICMYQVTVPFFIIPTIIQSFVEYYVLHRGDQSFRLSFSVS